MNKIPPPAAKNLKPWLLSTASGLMLVLIFPRFDQEWLAWFALVPLFFAIHDQPPSRAALYGFWTGFVFYFGGLTWVTNTMINYGHIPTVPSYLILMILVAYLSFYLSFFCFMMVRLTRGRPLVFYLLAPVLWTSLEYLRSTHPDYGFSWLGLGYSQYESLPVIQLAEYTGIYGITALILFVNGSVFLWLHQYLGRAENQLSRGMASRVLGILLVVVGLWWGYGINALNKWTDQKNDSENIRIGLAQGNIEQHLKWNPLYQNQVINIYRELTLEAAKSNPDLIVWPEAAVPFFYTLNRKESEVVNQVVRDTQTPLLLGSPYQKLQNQEPVLYNSAYLVSPEGKAMGRYDKIHLVPFGEFVPFRTILWFVEKMVEGVGNFGTGTEATVFDLDGGRFGVSICYEITFPDLVRRPVRNGAEFLVNITNDAWFGRSAASYQHISMGALRAVENRVPIVRAANTGISGTIDPSGRIRQTTGLFQRDLVITDITPNKSGKRTYYSKFGDVFAWLCLALSGLIGFWAWWSGKQM